MKKKLLILTAILLVFTSVFVLAKFSKEVVDNKAFATSTAFNDSTSQFSLDYSNDIGFAIYTDTDSTAIIIQTQGKVAGNWVTFKKDTLAKTDADGLKYVTLRNYTTDYLSGVNIARIYMTVTPDDDDTTGTYSIQVTAR